MRIKIFVVIALFFFVNTIATAQQLKKFSLIEVDFFLQLDEFMGGSSTHVEDITKQLLEFKQAWSSGTIPTDKKEGIIKTMNLLLGRGGKPFPQFYNYINCLTSFMLNNKKPENYENWDKGLQYVIAKKGIGVASDFCETYDNLLKNNFLSVTASTKWQFNDCDYSMMFEQVPLITFPQTTLKCYSKGDSAIIQQTQGVFYPLENLWIGKEGKVTWQRCGFDENTVYATLRKYKIDMTTAKYRADSVTFINATYYAKPMLGNLEEKVIADATAENASYPQFDSYEKIYEIPGIYPSIDYKGGFSMRGAKFIGSGNADQDASLFIKRKDTTFLICRSKFYVFKKDQIIGKNTSVTFRLRGDSIYHPGLLFKYIVADRQVNLIRDGDPQSMSMSPYYDTYHKVDMDFDQLTWSIDKNEMKMGAMKGSIINKASYESANYFRESRYEEIGLDDKTHPLVALKNLAKQRQTETFYAADLADYLIIDLTQVRQMCMGLSYMGLIQYDLTTEKITIKPRLYDYLKARVGKIDYDVIKFNSEHDMIGLENSAMELNNYDLRLYGVQRIQVSDSQNVIIYPRGRQLIIRKNRNLIFDGIIEAGYFTYFGQNFDFNYEQFKVNLENIDSLKMKVESFNADAYGMKNLTEIQNVIENVTGDLLIDDPNNKSSVKRYPKYPIFNSKQQSFVYYDYPQTQQGVYIREKFYFSVDPYTIDSLNSFTTAGFKLDGEFVSADIFPTFREKLAVQKDYSLGFTRTTPNEGIPVYQAKGTFYDTINLSNKGLKGFGKIIYLNSETKGNEFVFLPDSLNGDARTYKITKQEATQGAEFPAVDAKNVWVHWEPYKGTWKTTQKDSAIVMYDGKGTLQGSTTFTPNGLLGAGIFKFGNAQLTSDRYKFKEHEVLADTSKFDLLTTDKNKKNEFAFKTQNVASYINFKEQKATFKSNDELTVVQFPQNKYICYLNQFSWDMVTEEISLGSDQKNPEAKAGEVVGSRFVSVHPKQDTLNFVAPIAKYDLKKYVINAQDVKTIRVADAIVYPGQAGKVTVEADARMQTLQEAKVVANAKDRFHTLYNSTLDITGRMAYVGKGKYDYIDENKKAQSLTLDLIGVDTAQQTFATGKVLDPDNFMLSPEYQYQGKFRINAAKKDLRYEGAVRIVHECDTLKRHWLKFKADVNATNIFFPVAEEPMDIDNRNIYCGLYLNTDSTHIYTAFLSRRKKFNDIPIIKAWGFLNYSKASKKYIIASKEKIADDYVPGNSFAFHRSYCIGYGEGTLNLGADLGQVKLQTYGSVTHNIPMDKVNFETVQFVDFFFPQDMMEKIADTINSNASLQAVNLSRPMYIKVLATLLGVEKSRELQTELQLYGGLRKLPDEFASHALVFSQLDLQWNSSTKSYRSVGPLGIGNIYGKIVNKKISGYVEISKKRAGDIINIYLEISKNNWYYFNYTRELMQVASSSDVFNTAIETMKSDKKKLKTARKEAKYEFIVSSAAKKNIFVDNFERGVTSEEVVIKQESTIRKDSSAAGAAIDSTAFGDMQNTTPQIDTTQLEHGQTPENTTPTVAPKPNNAPPADSKKIDESIFEDEPTEQTKPEAQPEQTPPVKAKPVVPTFNEAEPDEPEPKPKQEVKPTDPAEQPKPEAKPEQTPPVKAKPVVPTFNEAEPDELEQKPKQEAKPTVPAEQPKPEAKPQEKAQPDAPEKKGEDDDIDWEKEDWEHK